MKHPYRRLGTGLPLLVTIIVHVILIGVAAAIVVRKSSDREKRTFEATTPSVSANKPVEHRLQIARRGGASGAAANPVAANRIYSASANALQMPEPPDLPSLAQGGFGSFGGMGSGVGMGAGVGMSTSLGGGTGLGGRGFMSLSFLGMTTRNVSKVVFVVDIGPGLLDIRKGGFRAFDILRTEISRLVASLPLSSEFGVVFFDNDQIRLFATELQPARNEAKTRFLEWIKTVNSDLQSLGTRSIPSDSPRWRRDPAQDELLKIDPRYRPPVWIDAVRAALEQKPDTIYLITGSGSAGLRESTEEERAAARRIRQERADALVAEGYDLAAVAAARSRALAKLREDLKEINQRLIAEKKDPFVVTDIRRALSPDFQAAVKKSGHVLKIDREGWVDKAGNLMINTPSSAVTTSDEDQTAAQFGDLVAHVARLQSGLTNKRANLNLFLFTGPAETKPATQKELAALASRNGGNFSLITTQRLEELQPDGKSP